MLNQRKQSRLYLQCSNLPGHCLNNWSLFYLVQNSVIIKHPNLDLRLGKRIESDGCQPQKLKYNYSFADVWGNRAQIKAYMLDHISPSGKIGMDKIFGNLDFQKLLCMQGN